MSLNYKETEKEIIVDGNNLHDWDSLTVAELFALSKQKPLKMHNMPKGITELLDMANKVPAYVEPKNKKRIGFLERVGIWGIAAYAGVAQGFDFLQNLGNSIMRLIRSKAVMRPVDFLFALEDCGYKAVPIVSLISFMVGLILAFVGAIQLKNFGAEIYVASLVAIGMMRIMGAIMLGVIMAGRTGAAYAATIGSMQVNEEVDALKTMGINVSDFLVLPRFLALIIAMPLLTMWADFIGMLGGAAVGVLMLDIPLHKYWEMSVHAVAIKHFMVGVVHGTVFGIIIALCGCYYGINGGRDAGSVGVATTKAVVSSIVWMIVLTGIITLVCQELGI